MSEKFADRDRFFYQRLSFGRWRPARKAAIQEAAKTCHYYCGDYCIAPLEDNRFPVFNREPLSIALNMPDFAWVDSCWTRTFMFVMLSE